MIQGCFSLTPFCFVATPDCLSQTRPCAFFSFFFFPSSLRSAGVGRTGTFIVIDSMIDMMHMEQRVDVFGFVSRIREQRCQLIQTDVSVDPFRPVVPRADSQTRALARSRGTNKPTKCNEEKKKKKVCDFKMVEKCRTELELLLGALCFS